MIHEEQRRLRLTGQAAADHVTHHEFFAQPHGHRHDKASDPAGRKCQLGFEQALEFQHRLVVEGDEVELIATEPSLVQTVRHRALREPRVMLLPGETLFLCRCDDVAIDHESGRAVVIEGRNAQNIHVIEHHCWRTLTASPQPWIAVAPPALS